MEKLSGNFCAQLIYSFYYGGNVALWSTIPTFDEPKAKDLQLQDKGIVPWHAHGRNDGEKQNYINIILEIPYKRQWPNFNQFWH